MFDPEEQGIIKADNLGKLLENCGSTATAFQVRPHFDTGDVILWTDFERIWKMLENQQNYGWNCLQCTYWNKMDASMCEMCTKMKGDAPIIEKPRSQQELDKSLNKKGRG